MRPTFNLPAQFHLIGGGTKKGVALPPAFLPPRGLVLSTGGGMKVGMFTAFGAAFLFPESGGGVNIGGESFSFRGGGVNIGGSILVLSGGRGGAKVGGGKNTTGGPSGVASGLGLNPIVG